MYVEQTTVVAAMKVLALQLCWDDLGFMHDYKARVVSSI